MRCDPDSKSFIDIHGEVNAILFGMINDIIIENKEGNFNTHSINDSYLEYKEENYAGLIYAAECKDPRCMNALTQLTRLISV